MKKFIFSKITGLQSAALQTNDLLHRYFSRILRRFSEHHFKVPHDPPCIDSSLPPSNFEETPPSPPHVLDTCGKPSSMHLKSILGTLLQCTFNITKAHLFLGLKDFKQPFNFVLKFSTKYNQTCDPQVLCCMFIQCWRIPKKTIW